MTVSTRPDLRVEIRPRLGGNVGEEEGAHRGGGVPLVLAEQDVEGPAPSRRAGVQPGGQGGRDVGQDMDADGDADEVCIGDRPRLRVGVPSRVQGAQVTDGQVLRPGVGHEAERVIAACVQGVHQGCVGVYECRVIPRLEQQLPEEAAPDLARTELDGPGERPGSWQSPLTFGLPAAYNV